MNLVARGHVTTNLGHVMDVGRDRTHAHWAMAQLLGRVIPVLLVLPGTGVLDARDPKTRADLASFTVRTRMRTTPRTCASDYRTQPPSNPVGVLSCPARALKALKEGHHARWSHQFRRDFHPR